MVLDSADIANVFYKADENGKPTTTVNEDKRALWTYLPQSPNGSMLITTRDRELASKLTCGYENIIEVGPMNQGHALELLAIKLGSKYDQDNGVKLAEALEFMPLAISQAAAYIQERSPRISLEKYLEEFQKSERNKLSLLNYDSGDLRRDRSAANSVITTWQISFGFLRLARPSATDLLSLMSFFDCAGIQESLVRPIDKNDSSDHEENPGLISKDSYEVPNNGFEDDIATLRNYCLITMKETGEVFEMHGLVQLSTRKWLNANGETERCQGEFISRLYHALLTMNIFNLGIYRPLFPHAEKSMRYRPIDKGSLLEWAMVLYYGGCFSYLQGKYTMAEVMLTIARDVFETEVGTENIMALEAITFIAMTYSGQARWDEAELLGIQVLDISKRLQTLASTGTLANIYHGQNRWKEAELLLLEALSTSKRVLGSEHPETLATMDTLASTYCGQNRWEEAELLQLQVLSTRKRVLGLEAEYTLMSMTELAMTYGFQRRWGEAESLEVQVLEACQRVLGPEHLITLQNMANLAITLHKQGRDNDARELLEQNYRIFTRVFGPEHGDTQFVLRTLQQCTSDNVEPQKDTSGR
ncbi:hypothetical protein F5Y03DRAFT_373633 [Xylaria venustula]|nr:hypothetical protein F5Y03DRAFT_373633 [Xylaria venustula]